MKHFVMTFLKVFWSLINHTPKTMPQFPYIPLKGYKNHSPTRQAGIVTHVPLCPEGKGQGHRDTTPHLTASRDARLVLQIFLF